MKDRKKLFYLINIEIKWKQIRYYDLKINKMLQKGKTLYDPEVIKISHKLEKCKLKMIEKKTIFEKSTGEKIVFLLGRGDW